MKFNIRSSQVLLVSWYNLHSSEFYVSAKIEGIRSALQRIIKFHAMPCSRLSFPSTCHWSPVFPFVETVSIGSWKLYWADNDPWIIARVTTEHSEYLRITLRSMQYLHTVTITTDYKLLLHVCSPLISFY